MHLLPKGDGEIDDPARAIMTAIRELPSERLHFEIAGETMIESLLKTMLERLESDGIKRVKYDQPVVYMDSGRTGTEERERDLLPSDFRLVKGRGEMKHERTLADYDVENGAKLSMLLMMVPPDPLHIEIDPVRELTVRFKPFGERQNKEAFVQKDSMCFTNENGGAVEALFRLEENDKA